MSKSIYAFNPVKYKTELKSIVSDMLNLAYSKGFKALSKKKIDKIIKKYPKDKSNIFSRDQLKLGIEMVRDQKLIKVEDDDVFELLIDKIKLKPMRTQSGVTTVTVLSKPFMCPGKCVFCPNDVSMPKSYIATEPGAQRALMNRFSPYLQTWNRLQALKNIGHPTDKIELLILGGSWSVYPEKYQIWFISECFRAMNEFGGYTPPLERGLGGVNREKGNSHLTRFMSDQKRGEENIKNTNNNYYNKALKIYARKNRKKQTPAESLLWSRLRNKQILDLRFLRQRVISKYIVDFLQPETKLVIEIDGASHDDKKYEYDRKREEEISSLGYKFLRFTEYEVSTRLTDVLETIYMYCEKEITHPNPPSREGIVTPPLERGLGGVNKGETITTRGFKGTQVSLKEFFKSDFNKILRDKVGDLEYNELINTKEFKELFKDYICSEESALPVKAAWENLKNLHAYNAVSNCRCVGLVLETRPDLINPKEVLRMRKLGATKVQLGIQTLDDKVSNLNKRGEGRVQTSRAFNLLRAGGFKIHAHIMPNLHGATIESDKKSWKDLFNVLDYKPDEVKIYPTSVIKNTELYDYYKKGLYKPYATEELIELVAYLIENTPEYCRLTRIIRDIPSTEITAGNKTTNLREIVEHKLKIEGRKNNNIRAREIKNQIVTMTDLELKVTKYKTRNSQELFLQYVTKKDNKIAGFLRLSLPIQKWITSPGFDKSKPPSPQGEGMISPITPELNDCAVIREVHVYGPSLKLKKDSTGQAQHLGLGTKLIEKAKELSKEAGFAKLAVISAIGTREYYKKRGFKLQDLYQIADIQREMAK